MNKSIDDKIKHQLNEQSKELDALVDESLLSYLKQGFAFNLTWLVKVGYAIAIVMSLVMFYCGYRFFTATPSTEVFWGVCLMLSFNAQVATKLWIFMHTNRNIIAKEIRLMELRRQS